MDKNNVVFKDIPLGKPLERGFEHVIEIVEGAKLVIITPYHHPKRHKKKLKKQSRNYLG